MPLSPRAPARPPSVSRTACNAFWPWSPSQDAVLAALDMICCPRSPTRPDKSPPPLIQVVVGVLDWKPPPPPLPDVGEAPPGSGAGVEAEDGVAGGSIVGVVMESPKETAVALSGLVGPPPPSGLVRLSLGVGAAGAIGAA